MPRAFKLLACFHLLLFILGIYNVYKLFACYVEAWKSLHQQGMGHGYLILMMILGSWWNLLALCLCFVGNAMMAHREDKPPTKTIALGLRVGSCHLSCRA